MHEHQLKKMNMKISLFLLLENYNLFKVRLMQPFIYMVIMIYKFLMIIKKNKYNIFSNEIFLRGKQNLALCLRYF